MPAGTGSTALGVLAALLLAAVVGLGVYIVVVRSKEAQAVDNWSRGLDLAGGILGPILGAFAPGGGALTTGALGVA